MYKIVDRLARILALMGGAVLSVLVVLTCLSIVGRSLNSILHGDFIQSAMPGLAEWLLATGIGPINGDFELVEAGVAFAIFAFLPLCQLNEAHAFVDIFTSRFSERANKVLRMVIDVIFASVLVLIAWQLTQGMLSKMASGQTSFLLQFPVWWGYALGMLGAVTAAFVSIFIASMRILEVSTGRRILPPEMGAEH